MTSLFESITGRDASGNEIENLPVWPALTTFSRMLAGRMSAADIIAEFALLDAQRQAEFAQVQTFVQNELSTLTNDLIAGGVPAGTALRVAKSTLRHEMDQVLHSGHYRYSTESEFEGDLGIS